MYEDAQSELQTEKRDDEDAKWKLEITRMKTASFRSYVVMSNVSMRLKGCPMNS
jgi:hypothetical protein